MDQPTDDEQAWGDRWLAAGDEYHARVALILDAQRIATEHEGDCDVCAAILEMVPRDVPAFLAAFDRSGPMSGQRVTVGGVWTFSRDAFLWHESQHGT